jgi:hypothetical protein
MRKSDESIAGRATLAESREAKEQKQIIGRACDA